ncbi:DUF6526 family protein [Cytobacillus dafuensis]|uniref:Uncharacterized protein n=1 Tax=Cytobacillus dafuensis TaxID=1742359 RepID=A0A5B8Z8I2_CYTDA|nr:DUF6526 family protein [Cytobacillus dafuensis]QED47756.1 hypothetical protein FSZ17_11085 [Cytobacillus dafuensis]
MNKQDYKTHTRMHPIYHYVLTVLVLGTLVAAIVQMVRSINEGANILQAMILFLLMIIIVIIAALVRFYPLKAQDRAIRAEENLRHYVLTGELLDRKLSMAQVVALRFADDNEFPGLSKKTAAENLKPDEIKKAIVNWRADMNRV